MDLLKNRVSRAMELTNDFYDYIAEGSLLLTIPDVPSNNIGQQAWCIVGARESYLKALEQVCGLVFPAVWTTLQTENWC